MNQGEVGMMKVEPRRREEAADSMSMVVVVAVPNQWQEGLRVEVIKFLSNCADRTNRI